jgi:putative membrane protein
MEEEKSIGNANDHLANERTYLAWLRTGVGIMVFGFVVVKFSLFVKQFSAMLPEAAQLKSKGYSSVLGIVLVATGALTVVLSYLRYKQTAKQLNEKKYVHSSMLVTVITTAIVLISILLIAYLVESI